MQMEIPIDEAGRVVIPKPMRDSLGLDKKDVLTVVEENGRIILSPAQPQARLKKKGDMWVITGGPRLTEQEAYDLLKAPSRERERHILGWDNDE